MRIYYVAMQLQRNERKMKKGEKSMKVHSAVMQPALVLQASSHEGVTKTVNVYWHDLMAAPNGKSWEAVDTSDCSRNVLNEKATVVYSDETGAAVLINRWGTNMGVVPQPWHGKFLMWLEWGDCGKELNKFRKKQFHVPEV